MSVTTSTPALNWSHVFAIPDRQAAVFAALTEGLHLKHWFAEHVEVDAALRQGSAFRFWGRHTMWVPDSTGADQAITRFSPPEKLSFNWTWAGCPSRVDLLLSTDGEGTKLAINHEFDRRLDHPEASGIVRDFWTVAIGNLRAYLKTGSAAVLPNYTNPANDVDLTIFIQAPTEAVYQALIDPALLNQWFAKAAIVEPRPGGAYSYGWNKVVDGQSEPCGPRRIIELIPGRKLVHDWQYDDAPNSRVEWTLHPEGSGTRVTIRHSGFAGRPNEAYRQGWAAACIELRELSQREKP